MGEAMVALVALTAMEIVLGIDNIVFIAVVTGRLPESQRPHAWRLGLALALGLRILLLLTLSWILSLERPVFTLESLGLRGEWFYRPDPTDAAALGHWQESWQRVNAVSWRDLILLGGGLFLVAKSVHEVHHVLEGDQHEHAQPTQVSFVGVLIQIGLLDIIFSLDSVITAVGMVSRDKLWVMVTAIVLAILVMMVFASRIGEFVHRHPTLKMLALAFLILIGVMLMAEGLGTHVNKGYIYFAMTFAVIIEFLNMRLRKVQTSAASA